MHLLIVLWAAMLWLELPARDGASARFIRSFNAASAYATAATVSLLIGCVLVAKGLVSAIYAQ